MIAFGNVLAHDKPARTLSPPEHRKEGLPREDLTNPAEEVAGVCDKYLVDGSNVINQIELPKAELSNSRDLAHRLSLTTCI